MSTSIGTLDRRARIKLWPVVVVLLAVTAVAVYITTTDRDADEKTATATVNDTLANTPSELRGGFAEAVPNTAANTPSELRGGFAETSESAANEQVGRRNVTPRVAAVVPNANTPSEISGGLSVGGKTDARFHPLP